MYIIVYVIGKLSLESNRQEIRILYERALFFELQQLSVVKVWIWTFQPSLLEMSHVSTCNYNLSYFVYDITVVMTMKQTRYNNEVRDISCDRCGNLLPTHTWFHFYLIFVFQCNIRESALYRAWKYCDCILLYVRSNWICSIVYRIMLMFYSYEIDIIL